MIPPRVRTPLRQRIRHFCRGPLGVLVWIAALAGVVLLFEQRSRSGEAVGIAYAPTRPVRSPRSGRLVELRVRLHDQVHEGQVLALLDPAPLEAELAIQDAELERLEAERSAARATLKTEASLEERDAEADRRRFEVDEENQRLALCELEVRLASDRIELERLTLLSDRSRKLFEARVAAELDSTDLDLRKRRLGARVERAEALLEERRQALAARCKRASSFASHSASKRGDAEALLPLEVAIEVGRKRRAALLRQREELVLRAPISGRISSLDQHEGAQLLAGDLILVLTPSTVEEALIYLPEGTRRPLPEGAQVIVKSRRERKPGRGRIARSAGAIVELPERLRRDPRIPEYGRALLVTELEGLRLLPGERISVHLP